MDGPRDELFAGAALAGDEHRRRRARDLRDEPVELFHRGVLADDLVEIMPPGQLGAEERDLALERPPFERPTREGQELVLLEGLGQVIEGAELHGRHGRSHRLHGRDEDHLDPFVRSEERRVGKECRL